MATQKEKEKLQGRNLLNLGKNQKGRNGDPIWKIAKNKADILICHEGAERAERIAELVLERIRAVRADLKEKYGDS